MQLRLGLLNEDVAHRFNILPTKSSVTFTTWINRLSKSLKNSIAQLPREVILDNLPEAFFWKLDTVNIESFQNMLGFLLKDQNHCNISYMVQLETP